jgi:hypothetical protein
MGLGMSAVRIAGAVVLAVAAVLAALLSADVRGWRTSLAQGDAVYAATPGRATWTPSTQLGGLAGSLLGVGDDVAARRGLQQYELSASAPHRLDTAVDVQALRSQAETALSGPASSSNGARASQARTLLGILAFADYSAGGGVSQTSAAAGDFADAVRADPSNDQAKFDLELLLRLGAAHGSRPGTGPAHKFGRTGRRGAGAGVPGSGY